MAKKIYVGNLPWSTTSASLETLFSPHGAVSSAEVISDRETGRSRGFGFVEMESDDACQQAIQALNGTEVDGRAITVNEARERAPRQGGGGGGYGGGRGGRGGGGGGTRIWRRARLLSGKPLFFPARLVLAAGHRVTHRQPFGGKEGCGTAGETCSGGLAFFTLLGSDQ